MEIRDHALRLPFRISFHSIRATDSPPTACAGRRWEGRHAGHCV